MNMKQISDEDFELFEKLKDIWVHANPDKYPGTFFICGKGGEVDEMGLPECIIVCPAMGLQHSEIYKKVK